MFGGWGWGGARAIAIAIVGGALPGGGNHCPPGNAPEANTGCPLLAKPADALETKGDGRAPGGGTMEGLGLEAKGAGWLKVGGNGDTGWVACLGNGVPGKGEGALGAAELKFKLCKLSANELGLARKLGGGCDDGGLLALLAGLGAPGGT